MNMGSMGGQARAGVTPPLPPNAAPTEKQSAPSLCQVIAMVMCYRRLGFVFLAMPTIFGLGPIVVNGLLIILDKMTKGFGIICLVLVGFSFLTWTQVLKTTSPSPEKYEEAYRKTQVILPMVTLALFSIILRMISGTIGPNIAHAWTPNVPGGFRPAIATLLINAAVLFRFVGPGSVIRCSTVPLASNDYINSSRTFWRDITAPSAPAGDQSMRRYGRRHQCAAIPSLVANTVATCIAGYLVAEYIFESSGKMRLFLDFTCLLTMMFHLIPNFNGTRHELNPKHYINQAVGAGRYPILISRLAFIKICKRVFLTTGCICVFGVACIGAYNHYKSDSLIESDEWPMILRCILTSLILGLYAAGVEEAGKAILFVASRLQRFVREVTSGRDSKAGSPSVLTLEEEETFVVDVALYSLLHGDKESIYQIGETTASKNPSYVQLESFETERSKNASVAMANVLLGKKGTKRNEVQLEEDIFRLSFLESLGGSAPVSAHAKTTKGRESSEIIVRKDIDTYQLDQRHREAIEYWVKPANKQIGLMTTQTGNPAISEPKVILLTRALTAYVSGLGIALAECSQSRPRPNSWLLRPGALVAAEYSVIALSRIFLVYFEHVKITAADWRRGQVSTLIPATINALFRLHCGVLDYANYRKGLGGRGFREQYPARSSAFVDMSENFSKDHPDLHQVLHATQEAAKKIVRQLGNTYNTMATKNAIEPFCHKWINQMMAPSREG